MKTNLFPVFLCRLLMLWLTFGSATLQAQNATASLPIGIGRNCSTGTATTHASDSVKVFTFNDATNSFTNTYGCKPNLQSPGFSPYSGSLAFNPQDQKLYYIETTNGVNSYIYRWTPNTSPSSNFAYSYSYTNRYIVGLDFDPVTGNGYQLEFNGSTAPYVISIRKVNFAAGTFGPSDTLNLPPGKNIYQQSGDVVFTPLGQLYFAFDNKLFQVDYSNYGPGVKLNTTYIDTLRLGNTLLGLTYAHGKFIASCQNSGNTSCAFKEIDISSGAAVISPITLPTGSTYTGTDLASMITGIGVAKRVAGVTNLSATSYLVQYDIKIKNFGTANLTNVQLTDSIKKVFGAVFVSANVAAVGTLPSGLTINPLYNGNTNCNIFTGGAGSTLAATPTDSATVRVSVTLNNPNLTTTYYSTTMGYAQNSIFATSVSDSSNQSTFLFPDTDFNSVPDDANEDIPTPLNFSIIATLPVSVVDFAAAPTGKTVTVNCSLFNNDGTMQIQVQKSKNGTEFEDMTASNAEAANSIKQYRWVDNNPLHDNINYYRLKFTKQDGTSFYSAIAKAAFAKTLVELQASPNPFMQAVNVDITLNTAEKINYSLINLNGKVVASGTKAGAIGANKIMVDNLTALSPGIYLLQLTIGDEVYNRKIMKSN